MHIYAESAVFECFSEAREAAQQEFFSLLNRPSIEAAATSPWTSEKGALGNDSHHKSNDKDLHANVHEMNSTSANEDDGTIPAADYPPSPTEAPSDGIHQQGSSSGNPLFLQSSKRCVVWRAFSGEESSFPSVWVERLPGTSSSNSSIDMNKVETYYGINGGHQKEAHHQSRNVYRADVPDAKESMITDCCNGFGNVKGVPWWQLSSAVQAVLRCMLDPEANTDDEK